MTEKVLTGKKNGMVMLMVIILGAVASIALLILGAVLLEAENMLGGWLLAVSIVGFIAFCLMSAGLKVLRPQEALVLTLFGEYIGTLRAFTLFIPLPVR